MLTLADIQTSRFQTAAGYGTASSDFLESVNDAVDGLTIRGDWSGLISPVQVQIDINSGCVVWPRFVGNVRKVNMCRGGSAEMRNVWWRFLDHRGEHRGWGGWRGPERNVIFEKKVPIAISIPGPGNYIQFSVTEAADAGATATLFGLDNNGQPLQTLNGDGTWSPGSTIVAGAQSTIFVSQIYRVVLAATNSTKTLSAYNPTTAVTVQLAQYQPYETNPSFTQDRITGFNPCCSGQQQTVLALIKFAKIPIQNPTDYIPINNRGALLDAVRACKAEDSNSTATAAGFWKSAIEKLNRQLEDDSPDSEFSAADNTWGDSRAFRNQMF